MSDLWQSGCERDGIEWWVGPSLDTPPDVPLELLITATDRTGARHNRTFQPTYGARYGLDVADTPIINRLLDEVITEARTSNNQIETICRKALLGPLEETHG